MCGAGLDDTELDLQDPAKLLALADREVAVERRRDAAERRMDKGARPLLLQRRDQRGALVEHVIAEQKAGDGDAPGCSAGILRPGIVPVGIFVQRYPAPAAVGIDLDSERHAAPRRGLQVGRPWPEGGGWDAVLWRGVGHPEMSLTICESA